MPARRIFDDANEKPDGSRYEIVAWTIPRSEDYPEGVKYSFQYMDADGNTLLRFDNAPYHGDVGRHHRHTPDGEIEALEYTGIRDLVARFHDEVNALYGQRTD